MSFDRLQYIDRLKEAGVQEPVARAHAEALRTALDDTVATKSDLHEAVLALRADFNESVQSLRADLKESVQSLRADRNESVRNLKADINETARTARTDWSSGPGGPVMGFDWVGSVQVTSRRSIGLCPWLCPLPAPPS